MQRLKAKRKFTSKFTKQNRATYIRVGTASLWSLFLSLCGESNAFAEEVQREAEGRAPASYIVPSIDEQKKKKEFPDKTPEFKTPDQSLPSAQMPSLLEDKDFGLSGDWGGLRFTLEGKGIEVALVYKTDLNRNLKGGVKRQSSYLDNVDLKITVDGEKSLGLDGYTFFLYGIANSGADQGGRPSQYVGDAQWTSNIETQTNSYRLYEAWIQKTLYNENSSVLVGIHDLNSEFYVTPSALMFLHSSFGLGLELSQTGTNGSSVFPYTSPAIRFRTESDHIYIQTALFGAQAGDLNHMKSSRFRFGARDGFLSISEIGLVGSEQSKSKIAVGLWTYTRSFDDQNEVVQDSTGQPVTDSQGNNIAVQKQNQGAYGMIDFEIHEGLAVFSTYGVASDAVNMTQSNFTLGLNKTALVSGKDQFGLGISYVRASDSYRRNQESQGNQTSAFEFATEMTYRYEILKGAYLQPDLQYVAHPSYRRDVHDAWVGNLRIELNF